MFPRTRHIETVVRLRKCTPWKPLVVRLSECALKLCNNLIGPAASMETCLGEKWTKIWEKVTQSVRGPMRL